MKNLTIEEELQAETKLFNKELDELSSNFGFRLILVLALCFGVVATSILLLPDLYFYSILQLLILSFVLFTWDFIDTNKKADKLLENSYAKTNSILNKYYPIGK
jgi:hypothetical protein